MKYVITGSAGNVSKPLAEQLLAAGHQVTVVGRNAAHLQSLTDKGAEAAIGSVEDVAFLKRTFTGADAVYTMVPPTMEPSDWKAYIAQIGKNYAAALQDSGVKYVVNLSSIGAHLPKGCGPVSGLYYVEEALNALTDINIKHLRPGYFYHNFLGSLGMVKHMNLLGSNFGGDDNKVQLAHPKDIAAAAAEELLNPTFTGHSVRYVISDERNGIDIAKVLGTAVGKPDLPWVQFSDEDALGGMLQAGLPEEIAKNYAEMGTAMRTGIMAEDYQQHKPATFSKTKLEDFAPEFAGAYNAQ